MLVAKAPQQSIIETKDSMIQPIVVFLQGVQWFSYQQNRTELLVSYLKSWALSLLWSGMFLKNAGIAMVEEGSVLVTIWINSNAEKKVTI